MKVEVLLVCSFIAAAQVDLIEWRIPLGRKDERQVIASRIGGGSLDLIGGEVLNRGGFDGVIGVTEFGASEFGGGRPRGENGRLRIVLVDVADGALVQDDEVTIGQVVFRGEGVWRVDPDAGQEGRGGESGESPPLTEMAMPRGRTDEED